MAFFGKRKNRRQESAGSSSPYGDLRDLILRTDARDLGFDSSDPGRVFCVLTEIAHDEGTSTLVSLSDGTTSLYLSTGGGVIGGGEHARVALLSKRVVAQAEAVLDLFEPTTRFPLPTAGSVRFQVLTLSGGYTAVAAPDDLIRGDVPLSKLFSAANDVLTELRLLDE